MSDMTPRLNLPTIRPGQAQKELSHNEALALLDLLTQSSAVAVGLDTPPPAPKPGQSWIIGPVPTDDWAGKTGQLAGWTEGGWRFAQPFEGMTIWVKEDAVYARFSNGNWTLGQVVATRLVIDGEPVVGARAAAIADPDGGNSIDVEARAAIIAVLVTLRSHGLIRS